MPDGEKASAPGAVDHNGASSEASKASMAPAELSSLNGKSLPFSTISKNEKYAKLTIMIV